MDVFIMGLCALLAGQVFFILLLWLDARRYRRARRRSMPGLRIYRAGVARTCEPKLKGLL